MEMFNQVILLLQRGLQAFGTIWILWGIVVLAGGIKDKTAPDIKQGIGQIVGGVMIVVAATTLIPMIQF